MDALAEEFVAWALEPTRNIEEAFAVEILVEEGLSRWKMANKIDDPMRMNFDAIREHQRARKLNPAHRRVWTPDEVRNAAGFLINTVEFKHWSYGEDRPLRDPSALRFCPKLKDLHLAPTELDDLDFLRHFPHLEHLWLQDANIEDLSGLAHCPLLRSVHLWLLYPWCNLRSLAALPELEQITLHANIPMLRDVPPLLKVTQILFNSERDQSAAIRNCHELPDMPLLREAKIYAVANLAGLEKFVSLQELTISGPYKDLGPFAHLPELRKLTLYGNYFHDLTPLASTPELSILTMGREHPIDYTPLLDSPKLREIKPRYGHKLSPEQAGINAALGGWDNDFLLHEPRPLPAPLYRFIHHRENPPAGFASPSGHKGEKAAPAIKAAEGEWISNLLERVILRKFGRDWGNTYYHYYSGSCDRVNIRIHDIEVADNLPELIALLREQLRWTRNRWIIDLTVDIKSGWQKDPEAWKDPFQEDLEERLSEARDAAERRRDYLAYIERLKIYELRKEQGDEPSPAEFALPPGDDEEEDDDSDLLEPTETGEDDEWEAPDHPKWHDYFIIVDVCEEGVWVHVGYGENTSRLLLQPIEKFPGWSPDDDKEDRNES